MGSTHRRSFFSTRSTIKEPPSLLLGHPAPFSSYTLRHTFSLFYVTTDQPLLCFHVAQIANAAKVVGELAMAGHCCQQTVSGSQTL